MWHVLRVKLRRSRLRAVRPVLSAMACSQRRQAQCCAGAGRDPRSPHPQLLLRARARLEHPRCSQVAFCCIRTGDNRGGPTVLDCRTSGANGREWPLLSLVRVAGTWYPRTKETAAYGLTTSNSTYESIKSLIQPWPGHPDLQSPQAKDGHGWYLCRR